jgi:hypothetical protein
MLKASIAFFLGLFSFFLFMFVGEAAMQVNEAIGPFVALILMAAYFFICQFLLSRGHTDVFRKDWRIMLVLNAMPLLLVIIMVLAERREVVLSQGLGLILSCCGGTLAGAAAASLAARRKRGRQ